MDEATRILLFGKSRGGKMNVFKKPNLSGGWKCPVCGKSDKKEVVLIGIAEEEGYNIKTKKAHLDCIKLIYDTQIGFIYQKIGKGIKWKNI